MQTQKIESYTDFVKAGRPYTPMISPKGKLLLPNFETGTNTTAIKHKKRLAIASGVILNSGGLTVAWVCSVSRVGFRSRWLYWRNGVRVLWFDLSWDERLKVIRAFVHRRNDIFISIAPTRNFQRWQGLL